MASWESSGFEPIFVDHNASKEYTCPVCLSLAVQPQLNPSCGHHYCRPCTEKLVQRGQPCPVCRVAIINPVPDLHFERKMKQLQVRCAYSSDGCQWVGQLSEFQAHMEHCALQLMDCEFSFAGCRAKLSRNNSTEHMQEALAVHVGLLSKQVRQKNDDIVALKAATVLLGKELEAANIRANRQIETAHELVLKAEKRMQSEVEKLQRADTKIQKLEGQLAAVSAVAMPKLVMKKFYKHMVKGDDWYSPPFYSHIGGYKMCLRVRANGQRAGAGSHVSVYVHLKPGENDRYLKWPFQGEVTVQLVNHRAEHGHIAKTVYISGTDTGRVIGQDYSHIGQGFNCFASHADLPHNTAKDTEFLTHDSLTFQVHVTKVQSN